MSLKGILDGIDVDVILEQLSTDQSPPGLLGTYKRLDGIKGCEYRTSPWHWVIVLNASETSLETF